MFRPPLYARAVCLAAFVLVARPAVADEPEPGDRPLPAVAQKIAGLTPLEGLLTLYPDPIRGRVWLQVPASPDPRGEVGRYLLVAGLRTGMGSNPVGLDRNKLGPERVVALRRRGDRVFLEQLNLDYRALGDDAAERAAVSESFATSIIWAGRIEARDEDGTALVDLTSLILADGMDVVGALERAGEGDYTLDPERSVVELEECRAFPENIELEGLLTFAGKKPGVHAREAVPAPESLTVTVHRSLLKLPDDGYRPRRFDTRIGFFAVSFVDHAAALGAPLRQRWIVRHRLEKTDPSAPRSTVKEPIVYHVDRGAPEPVRSALVEGASWWAEAFEAAGFIDAFRVELLPEGVHPLDARYNVISWVHRSTRGWSYGGGIRDPRSGEMIKGNVTLGSLRVRQDILLFEGLLGTAQTGTGAPDDPVQIALARIRQLAAHEVGHTLGLAHNFAASTYGRASVMDYPAPLVKVGDDGSFDVSEAYDVGIGVWDSHCIRYGYGEFAPGVDEENALAAMAREGLDRGYLFLSDADARPAGAAHPLANLWDNGADPVAALATTLRVRRLALERFSSDNIAVGRPLALLEEVFAPLYFHHRYQLDAAAKSLGGVLYGYAVRGDGQPAMRPVAAAHQRRALETLLSILAPESLDIPESALAVLLPRSFAEERHAELPASATRPVFDALGVAATAADGVAAAILQPQRCARLVDQHRRDPTLPDLREVLRSTIDKAFERAAREAPRLAEIRRTVRHVVVRRAVALAAAPGSPPGVQAVVEDELRALERRLRTAGISSPEEEAHRRLIIDEIGRHLTRERGEPAPPSGPPAPPPGSPIGTGFDDYCGCAGA